MSQGENPAQNHRMETWESGRILALEQGSLSIRESWGKAFHLGTLRSLGCLFWEGLVGEFQGLYEGMFVKGPCILPGIKRKQFTESSVLPFHR